ncbi:hypothetical protein PFICI_09847 [Pestalotiopsis fici W106-1]|uniref:Uncharacterized protein n=1 Tax=Pestalotiopsis fici (strain W106-1 / CGMCC3.15140) TaxID=1229662 RepID=W3WVB5_PESFW|nr:uncharacterized protein PFICI_09847 [Pestalotiopsis fici W106-1]ETS77785.1 hypothetical protein PFICI_09847 [Pestalotiopsis fici W106-1]
MENTHNYWPGGIPAHVRFNEEPIYDSLKEHIKAWQLFLEENAGQCMPQSQDDQFAVTQRRRLVEQWAQMRQEDRDAYHRRAPIRNGASWCPPQLRDKGRKMGKSVAFTQLIAPWPLDARGRALWTKVRIMLYALDGENGSQFDEQNSTVGIVVPHPAVAAAAVTPADFLQWCYIEDADFDSIAMTVAGRVICHRWDNLMLFADREALETGFLLLCELDNNGQVRDQARVWPPAFKNEYIRMTVLCKPLDEIRTDDRIPGPGWVGPIDMEEPMLDLLESKRERYFPQGCDIDLWMEAIERCAPGYLDMEEEGNGMAPDYDHALFRSHAELEDMPWEDEQ